MQRENLIVGKHYPALDGLRGIAVLLVIMFHASNFSFELVGQQISGIQYYYYILTVIGETGVDLFFVLSGFLITGILLDTHKSERCLKNFYIRRVLRIFPLYFAMIFLSFAVMFFFTEDGLNTSKALMYVLYLQNWSLSLNLDNFMYLNHMWSLAVEEQFYIFWPILLLFFYRRSSQQALLLCLALIFMTWFSRLYFVSIDFYHYAYSATCSRMDALCLGAALSIYFLHYKDNIHLDFKLLRNVALIISALVLLCLFLPGHIVGARYAMMAYGTMLFSILYVVLVAYVFLSDDSARLKKFCSHNILQRIGRISYGVYIYHFPIMIMIGNYLYAYKLGFWINNLLLLFVGGAMTLCVASISYRYFEKPVLRLKDKYASMDSVRKP